MNEASMFANYKVLLPTVFSLFTMAGFIAIVFLMRKRKMINQSRITSSSMSDSPSTANLQNKQNRDLHYQAVRCQSNRNSNSNDSESFKAEGNGNFEWIRRFLFEISVDGDFFSCLFVEYIEDICPYATFQLNKQTYSESSYSGNVYSGPYHSVRGSFVYHDAKPDGSHVSYFILTNFIDKWVIFIFTFLACKVQGARIYQSPAKRELSTGPTFGEPRYISSCHIIYAHENAPFPSHHYFPHF